MATRLADLKCYVSNCLNLIGPKGARGLCTAHYQRRFWTGSSTGSAGRRVDQRIFEHVEQRGECWEWTGPLDQSGYGLFSDRGADSITKTGTARVHIWSYVYFVAEIPLGFQVDHTCHSKICELGVDCPHRRCINPTHLEAVPPIINVERGRGAKRSHCPHDHEYTEANTYVNPKGAQVCRKCMARHRANYEQNRKQRKYLSRRAA